MTRGICIDRYFDWLCDHVEYEIANQRRSYGKLLTYLYDRPFIYSIPMDSNRVEDGIELRYQFAVDIGAPHGEIASHLDNKECSLLEMMVALSMRGESIIHDSELGDRTGQLFWNMIINLGLIFMTDSIFDIREVDRAIDTMIERRYERTGEGGLFTVRHPQQNLRNVEIWYQMMWYLDEIEQIS